MAERGKRVGRDECGMLTWRLAGQEGVKSSVALKSTVSLGLVSMAAAGGLSTAAHAQEGEAVELPQVEVRAPKPKKKATRKAPRASRQTAGVVSEAPLVEPPAPAEPAFGDGIALTPETGNTLQSGTGIGRLPGTVQDTPQTISVIPQKMIEEQNITTLDQALRNVPSVTVAIGEGGGGMNGDQFRIRGFQAKGDIYIDGLRDFGVYVRDSFAYQQVEVIKGPSSEIFGMGTTGGAINIQQKTAHLGDAASIEGTAGMGPYWRSVGDINRQVNATTAVRAVGMIHDQELVDRDHLYTDRWGFLGSVGFGLGTDTTWTLNYLHQTGDRKPDFGVPIFDPDSITVGGVTTNGPALGRPVTEFGVNRSNFYGKVTDGDDSDVDMLTSRFTRNVAPWLTFHNDTRVAWYDRDFAQTVPNCPAPTPGADPYTCGDSILNRRFNAPYGIGGAVGFVQDAWGAQNVTTAVAEFSTGRFKHRAIAGIDAFYQEDSRNQLGVYDANGVLQSGSGAVVKDPGTIGRPNYRKTIPYSVRENPLALKAAEAQDFGLFASDQIWLTETFSLLGGVRWDDYNAEYRATDTTTGLWTGGTAVDTDTDSQFTSPKASAIWEPAKNQTYYVSWARSFTPQGQFITNDNSSVNPTSAAADPEENELWEIGAKLSTRDGRLGLTVAGFEIEKGNASFIDPTTGDTQLTGETQRVRGIEVGVTGSITKAWTIQFGYAYLDSEILSNPASTTAAENEFRGNEVAFVSRNSLGLWTTYDIADWFGLRGDLLLGGGILYADRYFVNSQNTSIVPSKFSLDAMISYEINGWRYAVNGYNLTDELNYDAGFGNRAVPSPGTTVLATIGKKF